MVDSERYPRVRTEELSADGRELRERIVGGARQGSAGQFEIVADDTLDGPFGVFLFSPAVGAALEELGTRLRFHSHLPDRLRELATLAVASSLDSVFELAVHRPLAQAAGVSDAEVRTILHGGTLENIAEDRVVRFCRANAREVAPVDEFEAMAGHYDRTTVFEILALVAYYRGLASMLDLLRIRVPPSAVD